ncbi:hypothetical protein RHGRI_027334 [Rhododendron griersonianum]|uniref:Uncharacterized protein n=1 Tax=Rhododendron griersonianum TaxID=479676 RepID=A0AAV6J0F4_9ERIC|nr:hypothetical protein RHGRI_027334 [Rhododendron griersonianum]
MRILSYCNSLSSLLFRFSWWGFNFPEGSFLPGLGNRLENCVRLHVANHGDFLLLHINVVGLHSYHPFCPKPA